MHIEVNSDIIKKQSKLLEYQSEELNTQIKTLNSVVEKIDSAWQGDDAKKLIQTLTDEDLTKYNEIKTTIEEYSIYLTKAMQYYDTLDNTFASISIDV